MSPFALAALLGFAVTAALAVATRLVSLKQHDVSLVDRMWALLIAAPILAYAWVLPPWTLRTEIIAALLAVWAIRLAVYVSWRNWGHGEDRRYQAIRARNGPNFPVMSLVWIFLLQAVLAWLVSTPLLAAFAYPREWSVWIDCTGATLVVVGIVFEAVGDQQLASFKADAANKGKVMDRGVWRYTRHPNYFGEFCVWWGFFVMVLPLGWWSVISPIVMSVLLLKVSGVGPLEKDIGDRRPAYRDYIARTNAFFPGPVRRIR
jgi:steroid 5-alpha reductase family enzyme